LLERNLLAKNKEMIEMSILCFLLVTKTAGNLLEFKQLREAPSAYHFKLIAPSFNRPNRKSSQVEAEAAQLRGAPLGVESAQRRTRLVQLRDNCLQHFRLVSSFLLLVLFTQ